MRVIGESVPGSFRSSIQLVREGSESLRATVPDGVAKVLGAVPDGSLVWTVDLKAGRVTVSAEPPEPDKKKSSKRD
jgi:hypothetical protein